MIAAGTRVEVTIAYTSHYPDPLCFEAGAVLEVGRGDPEYPGWFWCRAPSGKEGWVHRSYLAACAGTTTSLRAYNAHELTAVAGEKGEVISALDGWVVVRLGSGEEGWIPESHISAGRP